MIDITKKRFLKYFLFSSLYFSEGIELALATIIIPIYLNVEKGFSIPLTTLVAGVVMVPWILKFIWGGIVDYFIQFGRKKFILFGGLLSFLSFFTLVFVDPVVSLIPFVFLLFLSHVGVGFLDVSADAWAIEISVEKERGKINGAMWVGQFIGWSVGSFFLSLIAQQFSYSIAFLITSLIIVIIILFPLLIKETKIVKKHRKVFSLLIIEFKKKTTQLISFFGFFLAMSWGILIFTMPLYMSNSLKLHVGQIGLIASIMPILMIVGAFVGGIIFDRWGRKIPLYSLTWASVIFISLLIYANTWIILIILYSISGFLRGGYTVGIGTVFMDVTNPKIGATQFSILTSITNFGEIIAGILAGTLIVMLGFNRVFLYAALFLGPALLILHFVNLNKSNEKYKSKFI